MGGIVSYANSVKEKQLGVTATTLASDGAVSEACALEMAQGVRLACDSTYGLSITGIAGPSGGSAEKPAGTVWIAVAGMDFAVAKKVFFPGGREQVRTLSAFAAVDLLRKVIQER